jgi:hypothetical protein
MKTLVRRTLSSTMIFLLFFLYGISGITSAATGEASLLIINKKTNKLAYFKNGVLVRTFPIATGAKPEYTPEGTFTIVNKIKNRPYYKDNIPGGDPRNPLGDRWLGLNAKGTYGTTYSIHGNNNPKSIGTYISAGCIRMHNDDVHWLYDEIELHTKVVITLSELSFEELAAQHHYELIQKYKGTLMLDGQTYALDRPLLVYQGITYLPLRTCLERLGGHVHWDGETRIVTSIVGDRHLIHVPETSFVDADGTLVTLSAPSINWEGTLMVPLRDIAELMGRTVHWDAETKEIQIYSKGDPSTLF